MMRIEAMLAQFKHYSLIANNRNPYANCASILYRLHDGENASPAKRLRILETLTEEWLHRSGKIKELVQKLGIPLVTYEAFCENPATVIKSLNLPDGVTESMDLNAKVKVKDYEAQEISNQNERQISRLSSGEIESCSAILNNNQALLSFYEYDII